MIEILLTLIPIFTIMFIGAFAERMRILPVSTASCLNSFVYCFSLPLLIFSSMSTMNVEAIPHNSALGFLIGILLSQAVAHFVLRFLGENNRNACMGSLVSAFPNCAYMGLPIVALLYPDSSLAIMNVTITIILPTIILVYTDTFLTISKTSSLSFMESVQNILKTIFKNQILICFFLGVLVAMTGVYVPESILHATKMLGSTAAPCALFCMGMSLTAQITQRLAHTRAQKMRDCENAIIVKDMPNESILLEEQDNTTWHLGRQVYLTCHKLLFMPCIMFICCYLLGVRGISLAVLTLISAMPSAVSVTVLADKHKVMMGDSAMSVVINTILSLFSLFVFMSLLHVMQAYYA